MSLRFRARLQTINVDPRQLPLIDEFIKESTEEAARIWVRAAVARIPVWSGASRATLEALASAVNETIDIDVRSTAPDRVALGRLYSSGGIEKLSTGDWRFVYESNLRYLAANETTRVAPRTEGLRGSLIQATPYNFRQAGNEAVEAYANTLVIPYLKLVGGKA